MPSWALDIRTDLQVRRSAFCDWSRHHALTSELDLQVASGSREPGGPDGPAGPQLIRGACRGGGLGSPGDPVGDRPIVTVGPENRW